MISDNTPVNAATVNAALASKTADNTLGGKQTLSNSDPASGSGVANLQRALNSICSATGMTNAQAYNFLFTWAADYVGAPSDTIKQRIDAIVTLFNGLVGHTHDGTDGQAPLIDSTNVDNVPLIARMVNPASIATITNGSPSVDVSSLMTGETPSTSATVKGFPVNAPYNKVLLREENGTLITHGSPNTGEEIFGRLTESSGVWTITFFYINSSGVETATNFLATYNNVKWYSQKLINPITDTGYTYDSGLFTPSTDAVADMPDASPTQAGKINTGAQTIGGDKTFNEMRIAEKLRFDIVSDAATTGANALLPDPSKPLYRLTNGSLVSLEMIDSVDPGRAFILINETGVDFTVLNETGGTATKQIVTGTGNDMLLKDKASLWLVYDATLAKWRVVGGSGSGGSGVILDTFANISALTRVAGAMYFATDELQYLGDNGTDLIPLDVIVDDIANEGNYTGQPGKLFYDNVSETLHAFDTSNSLQKIGPMSEDPASAGNPGEVLAHDSTNRAKFKQPFFERSYYLKLGNISSNGNSDSQLYSDGAQDPIDANGGSPSLTVANNATTPIAAPYAFTSNNNLRLTAGGIGDGYRENTEEINREDYGKIFKLELNYNIVSGTYTEGDLGIYILDAANTKIGVSPTHLVPKPAGMGRMEVTFQMPVQAVATALQKLKICLHQRTSNTGYVVDFRWKIVEHMTAGFAPIQTNLEAKGAMTIEAVTSNPTKGTTSVDEVLLSRQGQRAKIIYRYKSTAGGANGSGIYKFKMPAGYKIDTSLITIQSPSAPSVTVANAGIGTAVFHNVNVSANQGHCLAIDEDYFGVLIDNGWVSSSVYELGLTSLEFTLNLDVPIKGWSSQTQGLSEYDGRVIAASANGNPAGATSGNPIIAPTVVYDTHGKYDTSTGQYRCLIAGKINLHGALISPNTGVALYAYKNGSSYAYAGATDSNGNGTFDATIEVAAGDLIDLRPVGASLDASVISIYFDFTSGAQQIVGGIDRAAVMTHAESSGTGGGNTTGAYSARKLNTLIDKTQIIKNPSAFTGTGGTNTQFDLDSGTYEFEAELQCYSVNNYIKARLYNVTDTSVVALGSTFYDTNGAGLMTIKTVFSIVGTKTFEVQTYGGSYTNGNGIPATYGDDEIYSIVKVKKVGP
jgi:hypothetical protein